jgi:hypothetical protein
LDLPPGVELLGYERSGDGHGFEVKFPLPKACRCEKCGHEEPSTYEYKNTVYVVRDLDLNRAADAVERTIAELREIVGSLKAVFLTSCTQDRKSPEFIAGGGSTGILPLPFSTSRKPVLRALDLKQANVVSVLAFSLKPPW